MVTPTEARSLSTGRVGQPYCSACRGADHDERATSPGGDLAPVDRHLRGLPALELLAQGNPELVVRGRVIQVCAGSCHVAGLEAREGVGGERHVHPAPLEWPGVGCVSTPCSKATGSSVSRR